MSISVETLIRGMSWQASVFVTAVLFALMIGCCWGGALPKNAALQNTMNQPDFGSTRAKMDSPSQKDGVALLREKRRISPNNYLIAVYLNTHRLKMSNCTGTLLNQTVSYLFCQSNKVIYSNLKAPVEGYRHPLQNYTYELCSNVTLLQENDTILGHDFVIFKRPSQEEMELDILLLQVINPGFLDVVSHRKIPANTSGWQVFHIESKFRSIVGATECVIMYVRGMTLMNETVALNRSELARTFVLDEAPPTETSNKPMASTFIIGKVSFPPFFVKRSVEEEPDISACSKTAECVLEPRSIDLDRYFPVNVLIPQKANLGRCVSQQPHFNNNSQGVIDLEEEDDDDDDNNDEGEHKEEREVEDDEGGEDDEENNVSEGDEGEEDESGESGSGLKIEDDGTLYQCVPTQFKAITLLIHVDGAFFLISIPDFIITECSAQPCKTLD